MADNKVYVLDAGANQYEAMTKEQIITAITQAVNDGTISDIDAGFITKIQEMNKKGVLKWWVGTQAEFNALETKDANTLYLFTDDPLYQDLLDAIDDVDTKINNEVAARTTQNQTLTADVELLNKRGRLIATSNRSILTDAILYQKTASAVNCPTLTFNLDMTSMEAGEGEILFNLHLDLKLDARQVRTGLMPTRSLDIPFTLNWKRVSSVITNMVFRFLDSGTTDYRTDLKFNFDCEGIVYVTTTLVAEVNYVAGTRVCTIEFHLEDCDIKGCHINLSSLSVNSDIDVLDFTEGHQIDIIAAYLEQVNGIVEGE